MPLLLDLPNHPNLLAIDSLKTDPAPTSRWQLHVALSATRGHAVARSSTRRREETVSDTPRGHRLRRAATATARLHAKVLKLDVILQVARSIPPQGIRGRLVLGRVQARFSGHMGCFQRFSVEWF